MTARLENPEPDLTTKPVLYGWQAMTRDCAQMVRFYSRIPVPKLSFETDPHALPDFRTAPRMLAIAGLIIGLPGAIVLWMGVTAGLPALVAAGIAIAVSVFASGAFHEDGLADTFDGLGGGVTIERKLEIMKDSRIGSFGGAALIIAIGLRFAALGALIDETSAFSAALLMLVAAALSRTIGLTSITLLPPARPGGFSSAVGRPTSATYVTAMMLAVFFVGAATSAANIPVMAGFLGIVLAMGMALLMTGWSLRAIGGQTGDIAGAVQQIAEIAFYAGVLIFIANT
jgi:adenosylcobinamide-GDP ribazoletransferase